MEITHFVGWGLLLQASNISLLIYVVPNEEQVNF